MLVPSGIGYSLPLLLLCAALSVWCGVLLAPWPFNKPGIEFARLTWTKTGTTVVHTLSAVLVALMLSPLYDTFRIGQASDAAASAVAAGMAPPGSQAVSLQADEGLQARTQLNLVLTAGALAWLHMLRKLGRALDECAELRWQRSEAEGEVVPSTVQRAKDSLIGDFGAGAAADDGVVTDAAMRKEL